MQIKIQYPKKIKDKDRYYYKLYRNDRHLKQMGLSSVFVDDDNSKTYGNFVEYQLVEQNMFVGKFWWWFLLFEMVFGVIGGVSSIHDFKDTRETIRTIKFEMILSDSDITIYIDSTGNISDITNVPKYNIIDTQDVYNPIIKKRIKRRKHVLIIFILVLLALVVFALTAAIISSNLRK